MPLKRLVSCERQASAGEVPYVGLEDVESGTGKLLMDRMPETMESPSGLDFLPNDVLFGKLRPYLAKSFLAQFQGCCSSEFLVLRAKGQLEPRFLAYLVQSQPFIEWAKTTSDGAKMPRSDWDAIGAFETFLPSLERQRAIVASLDADTARLDALIEKKRSLVDLLGLRQEAVVEQYVRRLVDGYGSIPLKHATRAVEVGIVVTPSAWYAETGVPAIRGLNVKPGKIVLDDMVYINDEGHRLHQKSTLRAGDVVCVRTGQAGAAAVVPAELDGCNCVDLVIVRPSPGVDPKFIEFVLNSDWTQKHIDEYSVGTIQSHFNIGAMKELPVPIPPADEQSRAVGVLSAAATRSEILVTCLSAQLALLARRRQALITTAVAGEASITGAA